jgi:hypothetical protein
MVSVKERHLSVRLDPHLQGFRQDGEEREMEPMHTLYLAY